MLTIFEEDALSEVDLEVQTHMSSIIRQVEDFFTLSGGIAPTHLAAIGPISDMLKRAVVERHFPLLREDALSISLYAFLVKDAKSTMGHCENARKNRVQFSDMRKAQVHSLGRKYIESTENNFLRARDCKSRADQILACMTRNSLM